MSVIYEQREVLQDFVGRLETLEIPYMLTGSMAMAYYAQPRMTADIDIVVELNDSHADQIIKSFEPEYYVPHGSMRSAIVRNSTFNMLHEKTLIKIDCVLRKTDSFHKNAFTRRRTVDFGGFGIWITSHEDLILSKLNWAKKTNSEMQLRDVTNLLRCTVDIDYLKTWSTELAVDETLNELLRKLSDE
jgi:hypothetical protein